MNASESLYAQQAKKHVANFENESQVMRDQRAAMDCGDCDAVLHMGVEAFGWIIQADNLYRRELYDDKVEHSPGFEDALELLFVAWLRSCEFINPWILKVQEAGYHLDHLEKFRKCEAEVRAIVGFHTPDRDHVMTDALRLLRDQAIAEHHNGQTAEFISE